MASSSYGQSSSPGRRAASFALAVAIQLAIVWLLFNLGVAMRKPSEEPPLSTFALDAERPAARAAAKATVAQRATRQRSASAAPPVAPRVPPPVPQPQQPPVAWPQMMSEKFDLAAVPRTGRAADPGRGDDDARGDSVAAYGPGAGPGGERLYNADWQREPTNGEIAGYIRRDVPPGSFALIACRTAENNTVENCRSLEEGPIGSGFASAMRQAAWQFRVLPPRIGGKRIIGAWVRICIDLRPDAEGRFRCDPRRD